MSDSLDKDDATTVSKNILSGRKGFWNGDEEPTIPARTPTPSPAPLEELTVKPQGKYHPLEKIGEGGMKRIVQVNDRDTARELAMATLRDDDEIKRTCPGRFVKEARLTANLEHPNIVPIHDIGVDEDGSPYFTMKLVQGETFAKILMKTSKDKPGYTDKYTLSKLLNIFTAVCDAIDFAHSKGIVHLDIKPENIQIGEYGEVLVLDWGLATEAETGLEAKVDEDGGEQKVATTTPFPNTEEEEDTIVSDSRQTTDYEKTLDGEVKGTPGFMAPEQAAGKNSERGPATDIYALGAILYTILTFKKPIKAKNLNEALEKTVDGDLVPIQEAAAPGKAPKPLAAVVEKAMALKPEDRYTTVRELKNEVEAYLAGRVTKAEKASVLRHATLFVKRNKALTALGTATVAAMMLIVAMMAVYHARRAAGWGVGKDVTPRTKRGFESEWIQAKGKWTWMDGSIRAETSDDDTFVIFWNKPVHGNVAVEFDAAVPNAENLAPSADLSVILAGDPDAPDKRGYFFQLGGIGNTSAVIQRRGGFMTSVGLPLEPGRKYHVRAEREGPDLRLYLDGDLILSARDIFYLEGGLVGLYTFGKGKIFSNIKIFRKDVPQLVPPTVEGDAFVREALAAKSAEERRKFLNLAKRSYERVFESHPNTRLGRDALLKKAYVCRRIGGKENLLEALKNVLYLKKFEPNLDLLLLEGYTYFDGGDFANAFGVYSKAVRDYPDSALSITALITGLLTPNESKLICPEIRQAFMQLIAVHNASPAFRCSSRELLSLDFIRNLNFSLLDCSGNHIASLEPIRGMNLKKLDCAGNNIESLEPIRGMELVSLECHDNPKLRDITPLESAPVRSLTLHGCDGIESLAPLADHPTIEKLTIPKRFANDPVLKTIPHLKFLNTEWDDWKKTAKEFFEEHSNRNAP
jgi:serine/threonine-protein kinase